MRRVLPLLVATMLAAIPGAVAGQPAPRPSRSITVTGAGTATVRPDTAHVTAGVVTQDVSAGRALDLNSAAMARVIGALRSLGVRAEDIRTVGVTVTPQHREAKDKRAEIAGYEVQNRVAVTVRDLAALGRLLDRIVAEGANTIGGIAFSVADPARAMDEARGRAFADARRAAETLARAAGVKLGAVLEISEAPAAVPRVLAAPFAAGVPIEPGEQPIHASLTVTFSVE